MHTQNVNTAAQKSSERWVKKVSLILAGAADRGHMSVALAGKRRRITERPGPSEMPFPTGSPGLPKG